jgi:hypothetical protein
MEMLRGTFVMVIQQGANLLLADLQGLIMFFRVSILNRFTEIIIRFTDSGVLEMIIVSASRVIGVPVR